MGSHLQSVFREFVGLDIDDFRKNVEDFGTDITTVIEHAFMQELEKAVDLVLSLLCVRILTVGARVR